MNACRTNHLTRLRLVLLAGVSCTLVGCQSARTWSPVSWFSNRQPDAAKIAALTESPQLPESPALKHTPTALASNNSPAATGGLAAQSNGFGKTAQPGGYQTGPYGMASAPLSNPATSGDVDMQTVVAAANTGSSTNAPSSSSAAFPSPYGGSYGGSTGYGPSAGYGATATAASDLSSTNPISSLAQSPTSSPYGLPEYPSMTSPGTLGVPATTVSGSPNLPLPNFEPSAPSNLASSDTSFPGTASPNSGYGVGGPNAGASSELASYAASVPGASAYESAPPSGNFAPGTTGRTTSYNFGSNTNGNSGAYPSPTSGLPPNTATGGSALVR